MSLRDKLITCITEVIEPDQLELLKNPTELVNDVSDAVLALIRDSVPPLVWIERRGDYWDAKGTKYQIAHNGDGKWRVRLNRKVIFRARRSMTDAKAAAQAHHVATLTDWMMQ